MKEREPKEQEPQFFLIRPTDLFPAGPPKELVRTPTKKRAGENNIFDLSWGSPLRIYPQSTVDGKKNVMITGMRMMGPQIMEMLGLVNDNFNPADVRNDWSDLLANPNSRLMALHRKIPWWDVFERESGRINAEIQSDKLTHPDHRLIPTISIRDIGGEPSFDFSNRGLKETHSLALGASFLAVLSRDVTDTWSKTMTVHHKGEQHTMGMGHNQAIVQALVLSETLFEGQFMTRLIRRVSP